VVNFSFGGTLDRPKALQPIPISRLHATSKWNGHSSYSTRSFSGPKLCDLFQIKRGLATGDNSFFILTDEQVREHGLPKRFLKPILPSPRYLTGSEIQSDAEGNPILERRLFLLDCHLPEDKVRRDYPQLADYLKSGVHSVANGYLCGSRSPWYLQENRPAPLLLCTYMGRSRVKKTMPFRFILNHSKATAANVYLLFYPRAGLCQALSERPELAREIWMWLNELSPKIVLSEGRVYGGGLHKLEPRELGNVPADGIVGLLGTAYQKPTEQLRFFPNGEDSASLPI
jgi:hypothetical protein